MVSRLLPGSNKKSGKAKLPHGPTACVHAEREVGSNVDQNSILDCVKTLHCRLAT